MKMIDTQKGGIVPPESSTAPAPSAGVPHPLDGSQFHNVVEEQEYSERPPTPEEQAPRRARHLAPPPAVEPHPDDPAISVGTSGSA